MRYRPVRTPFNHSARPPQPFPEHFSFPPLFPGRDTDGIRTGYGPDSPHDLPETRSPARIPKKRGRIESDNRSDTAQPLRYLRIGKITGYEKKPASQGGPGGNEAAAAIGHSRLCIPAVSEFLAEPGHRNSEHLAVFGHRTPGDMVAHVVEYLHECLIRQRFALILPVDTLGENVLDFV